MADACREIDRVYGPVFGGRISMERGRMYGFTSS